METTNFKTIEEIYSDIKENILNMDYYDVVALHNEVCNNISHYDSMIFENDPYIINDYFPDSFKALQAMFYGEYSPNHEFFTLNGYGNLESINDYNIMDHINIYEIIGDIYKDPYNYVDYVNFLTDEYIENIETLKEENK
jgi:hypothetical protein